MVAELETNLTLEPAESNQELPAQFRGTSDKARIFRIYSLALNNAAQTIMADTEPEEWLILAVPLTGANFRVYLEPAATGDFIALGIGGTARIPSRGLYITVQNTLATAGVVTVIALTGFPSTTIQLNGP